MAVETKDQLEEQGAEPETEQGDQDSLSPGIEGETLTHFVAGTTPQNELLELFIGTNAEAYLGTGGLGPGAAKGWSYNWIAAFFGLPWFFYRKLYLMGLAILLLPIIITVIIPQFAELNLGIAAGLGTAANSLYLWHANRKIDKLKKLDLPTDELKDKVSKAGGTSMPGAVFGALIMVALISLPMLEQGSSSLPDCNNAQVQKVAGNLMSDALNKGGVNVEGLKVYDFKRVENQTDTAMNLCTYTAEINSEPKTFYLSVSWLDQEKGQFDVRVGVDKESVTWMKKLYSNGRYWN